jgi:hypothetical protein
VIQITEDGFDFEQEKVPSIACHLIPRTQKSAREKKLLSKVCFDNLQYSLFTQGFVQVHQRCCSSFKHLKAKVMKRVRKKILILDRM